MAKQSTAIKRSPADQAVQVLLYLIVGAFALITLLPFIYIIAGSFATERELTERAFFLIPREFSLNAYQYILRTGDVFKGLKNTVIVTAVGTFINMFLSCTLAYPLSRPYFKGRVFFTNMVIVTMLFPAGMIPMYMVVDSLGLKNTFWALWLPGAINAFNMIIIKNYFQGLPMELEEAARIDGCSDFGIFTKIILPVIKPAMASWGAITLIARWNDFFWPLLYLRKQAKYTLMVTISLLPVSEGLSTPWPVILAGTTLVIIPIIILYLILEKFQKAGMMEGAVKG